MSLQNNLVEIEIPFQGFYNSIHDANIDQLVESEFFEDENGDTIENYDQVFNIVDNHINYPMIKKLYIEMYIEKFADLLGITLTDPRMESPKYYNYSTDRLFAKVDPLFITKVIKEVDRDDLVKVLRDNLTPCSGFIPHYSNDINEEKWEEILKGERQPDIPEFSMIMEAFLIEEYTDEIGYYMAERFNDQCYQTDVGDMLNGIHIEIEKDMA